MKLCLNIYSKICTKFLSMKLYATNTKFLPTLLLHQR